MKNIDIVSIKSKISKIHKKEMSKYGNNIEKALADHQWNLESVFARIKYILEAFKDEKIIRISVKKSGIGLLEKAIAETVWSGRFIQGEPAVVTSARHKGLLDKAHKSMLKAYDALEKDTGPELIAIDLKDAIFNLGLIIGKSVSGEVLDRIFENFCIGK